LDPIKRREKKEGSEKGEREAAWISLVGSFSPSVCVCVCVRDPPPPPLRTPPKGEEEEEERGKRMRSIRRQD
jgi:hypothetical protein